MACIFSKTINVNATILIETNQELGKVRGQSFKNQAAIIYYFKDYIACKPFPAMCYFNIPTHITYKTN